MTASQRVDDPAGADVTTGASLRDDLRVHWNGATAARDIAPFWAFGDGIVFGGYSAALTLVAACDRTGLPAILSSQTLFVEGLRPGVVELAVEVVRAGGATAAVRVTASQAGRASVVTQAWLSREPPASADRQAPQVAEVAPSIAPPLRWRAERMPFMGMLEERVLAYPDSFGESAGPARVDLWCRPRPAPVGSPGAPSSPVAEYSQAAEYSQVADVLILDAHMLDPVLWSRPDLLGRTATLDLAVTWFEPFAPDQWRALSADTGAALGGFATASGQLRDEQGRLRVTATSQGRVMRRRTH